MKPQVGILMGSASDLDAMRGASDVLTQLDVGWEMRIMSAHRTPVQADEYASTAADRGVRVIICGAGMAAHLAGAVAGRTSLPVLGVPLGASLSGLDALLATVQMPPGVPVGTLAVGRAGAKNAAWLALRILALSDAALAQRMDAAWKAMQAKVLQADRDLQDTLG